MEPSAAAVQSGLEGMPTWLAASVVGTLMTAFGMLLKWSGDILKDNRVALKDQGAAFLASQEKIAANHDEALRDITAANTAQGHELTAALNSMQRSLVFSHATGETTLRAIAAGAKIDYDKVVASVLAAMSRNT